MLFGCNVLHVNSLKCVLMNNQECKVRPEIININSNGLLFYAYSVCNCSRSSNNINDPYAKLFVPDVVKNINVILFNLTSTANETTHINWHETCKC